MTKFKIDINATPLFDRLIMLLNVKTGEYFPPKAEAWDGTLRTFELEPGFYGIALHTSGHSEVRFKVEDDGTVTPVAPFGVCLEVQGSNKATLLVKGFEVTLDARYLAMDNARGALLGHSSSAGDWFVHTTTRLLPATGYVVEQGSAKSSSFSFDLTPEGRFAYKPTYDVARGGFLGGLGTATLALRGYPLLVDATKVAESVSFLTMKLPEGAHNGVIFANILPLSAAFPIQIKGGAGQAESVLPSVQLGLDGAVQVYDGHVYRLVKDSFHGLTRLTIEKI